ELDSDAYFADVAKAVLGKSRWSVQTNDVVLWFFSFSKFLMYHDLDVKAWPGERSIASHELIASLLGAGFRGEPSLWGSGEDLDDKLSPAEVVHVLDADSSQAAVIEQVRRGANLVIQGPPGTGKSQTIGNIIAAAVNDGKKVLFVAEKMAALEVVKRRLDNIGLGDVCL